MATPAPDDVTVVAKNGDVVLACGGDIQCDRKAKLRVSSVVLMRAFSVFEAMLSTKFKEGNDLAMTSSVVISLPEDCSEMTTTLCLILHHRNHLLPRSKTPHEIVDLMNLAQEYICLEVDQMAVQFWMRPWMQRRESIGCVGKLLTIRTRLELTEECDGLLRDLIRMSTYHSTLTDKFTEYGTDGNDCSVTSLEGAEKYQKTQWARLMPVVKDTISKFSQARETFTDSGCAESCVDAEVSTYELF